MTRRHLLTFATVIAVTAGSALAATRVTAASGPSHPAAGMTPGSFTGQARDRAIEAVAGLGVSRVEAARRIDAQPAQVALAALLATGPQAAPAAPGAPGAPVLSHTASWIDRSTGELVVNVTDQATAERVNRTGARARMVRHGPARLGAVRAALAAVPAAPNTTVGVDPSADQVVVSVPAGPDARTAALRAAAGRFGDAVRVETRPTALRPHLLVGGDEINGPNFICSAGFLAEQGGAPVVVTAGHCTQGFPEFTRQGAPLGPTVATSFPDNDYGAVRVSDPGFWDPQGVIRSGTDLQDVTTAGRVPVGATVCKSGRTTGTTCGQVLQYDVSVTFDTGETVNGMTTATACTQPGDSGGGLFAGEQAQGIVSGGTVGPCGADSFSIVQPADEALSDMGLTLL